LVTDKPVLDPVGYGSA